MPDSIEKITGIHERKLIRQMVHTDQQLVAAHTNLINRTVPILKQYRSSGSGVIIRSPELDTQIQNELLKFESSIRTAIKASQEAAWNLADEKTDQIINSFIQGMPLSEISMEGLYRRNMDAFQSFQSRKYDGLQLSDRIWNMTKQNSDLLNNYVDNALITGRSAGDMSRDIREILNEPNRQFRRVRNPRTGKLELSREAKKYKPGTGKYRSSAQNAKRLARTETNMAYRTSDQERWKSLDFVLGYEVKIGNRHPKPDICDHAAGRYPKNFKFVGWHPQCLCYAIPILPTKDEFMDNLVDDTPLPGEVSDIPKSMKDYIETNRDRIAGYKRQPFWVQDNFKGKNITGEINKNVFPTARQAATPTAGAGTASVRATRRSTQTATQGTLDFSQPAPQPAPLAAQRHEGRATQGTLQFGKAKPARPAAARSAPTPPATQVNKITTYAEERNRLLSIPPSPERDRAIDILGRWRNQNIRAREVPRDVLDQIRGIQIPTAAPATAVMESYIDAINRVVYQGMPPGEGRERALAVFREWRASNRRERIVPREVSDRAAAAGSSTATKATAATQSGRTIEFEGDTGRIGMTYDELMAKDGNRIMRDAFGDDAPGWIRDFHARENNYMGATYYRVEPAPGEFRGAGAGRGLYLGRDKRALRNFYDQDNFFDPGIEALPVSEYTHAGGKAPKWLDLADRKRWDAFGQYAKKQGYTIETWGELVTKMGYDGIRYFDPMATGEEFVLFNTGKVQKVTAAIKDATSIKDATYKFKGTPMTIREQIDYLTDNKNGWSAMGDEARLREKLSNMKGFNFREFDADMAKVYKDAKVTNKTLYENSISIISSKGKSGFNMQREFFDDRVEHALLKLPRSLQGKDTGKDILAACYKQYGNMPHIKRATIHANIDVGGYAWAKYGFEMNASSVNNFIATIGRQKLLPGEYTEMRKILSDWKTKNKNAQVFPGRLWAEQPWGKKLLLNTHWWGHLDLTSTEAKQIFEAYINKKKK